MVGHRAAAVPAPDPDQDFGAGVARSEVLAADRARGADGRSASSSSIAAPCTASCSWRCRKMRSPRARAASRPTGSASLSYMLSGALGGLAGFAAGQLTFAYFALGSDAHPQWLHRPRGRRSRQQPRRADRRRWRSACSRLRDHLVRRQLPADDRGRPADGRAAAQARGPVRLQEREAGMTAIAAHPAIVASLVGAAARRHRCRCLGRRPVPAAPRGADLRLLDPDRRPQPGRRLHRASCRSAMSACSRSAPTPSPSSAGKMGWHPAAALVAAGALGGFCGLVLGLPSLRLPGFYFAMATLAFALIVGEIVLAQVEPHRRRRRPARSGASRRRSTRRTASTGWSLALAVLVDLAELERRPTACGAAA